MAVQSPWKGRVEERGEDTGLEEVRAKVTMWEKDVGEEATVETWG